jgi:putative intracellular protease/amidase
VGLAVSFRFSEDWDGMAKAAIFKGSGTAVDVALSAAGSCAVPHEVLQSAGGRLKIGVYGTGSQGQRVTPTVWADAGQIFEGAAPSEVTPTPATQSLVQQILEAAESAEAIAQGLQAAAEAGEFDGADGVSPTVSASAITGGHRLTITDVNGTDTVDVMDGEPGSPGRDGNDYVLTEADKAEIASDAAEIILARKTASGSTITITDGVRNTHADSLLCEIALSQSGSGTPAAENVRAISGLSSVTVTRQEDSGAWTGSFGSTIYGGTVDLVSGILTVTWEAIDMGDLPSGKSWAVRYTGSVNKTLTLTGYLPKAYPQTGREFAAENMAYIGTYSNIINLSSPDSLARGLRSYYASGGNGDTAIALVLPIEETPSGLLAWKLKTPYTVQLTPQEITMLEGGNSFADQSGSMTIVYPVRESGGVSSVNGQTGAVTLSIPTKTSELQNDSGFLTQHQDISGKLNIAQGSGNAGKFLVVGNDGNVTAVTMSAWQGGSY